MAKKICKGDSVFIPFRNGESISDSQLKPRMYMSRESFTNHFPGHYLGTKDVELVEYSPVVHGRWMLESKAENSNGGHTHYCDHCHDYCTTDADSLYFCPRCGAKMIEVEQPGRNGWKMELVDGELKRVWGVINERFVKTRTEEDFPNCGAKMDGGVCDG